MVENGQDASHLYPEYKPMIINAAPDTQTVDTNKNFKIEKELKS